MVEISSVYSTITAFETAITDGMDNWMKLCGSHFPKVYANFKHCFRYRFLIYMAYSIYAVHTYAHGEMIIS